MLKINPLTFCGTGLVLLMNIVRGKYSSRLSQLGLNAMGIMVLLSRVAT